MSDEAKAYRSLSMAPTTDIGKNHEIIDREIQNRESLKYGKNPYMYANMLPKLNDINHHRTSQRARYNYNVLTGGYVKRPGE